MEKKKQLPSNKQTDMHDNFLASLHYKNDI